MALPRSLCMRKQGQATEEEGVSNTDASSDSSVPDMQRIFAEEREKMERARKDRDRLRVHLFAQESLFRWGWLSRVVRRKDTR